MVVDLRVAIHVIHDRSHLLDVRVHLEFSLEPFETLGKLIIGVGDLRFLLAQSLLLVADDLDSSLAVGAEQSKANRQNDNGIAADDVSSTGGVGDLVKVGSPILVTDSRSTESNNSDVLEDVLLIDVDVADASKATSKTDTGDVESLELRLSLDIPQLVIDIIADGSPHVIVSLLDLAFWAGVFINDLKWIENVLPDVQCSIGVAEGKHHKFWIDAQDALDINLGLLDVVRVNGSICLGADSAIPKGKFLSATDDQRVRQDHLIEVGERNGNGHQQCDSH